MRGAAARMHAKVDTCLQAYLPYAFHDRKRNATGPGFESDSTWVVLVPSGGVRSSQLCFRKQRSITWQRRPAGWPSNSCVPGLRGEGRTPGSGRWCRASAMPRVSDDAPRIEVAPHPGRLRPGRRSVAPSGPAPCGAVGSSRRIEAHGASGCVHRNRRTMAARLAGAPSRLATEAASAPGQAADRTDTSGPPKGSGRRNMAYWALQ